MLLIARINHKFSQILIQKIDYNYLVKIIYYLALLNKTSYRPKQKYVVVFVKLLPGSEVLSNFRLTVKVQRYKFTHLRLKFGLAVATRDWKNAPTRRPLQQFCEIGWLRWFRWKQTLQRGRNPTSFEFRDFRLRPQEARVCSCFVSAGSSRSQQTRASYHLIPLIRKCLDLVFIACLSTVLIEILSKTYRLGTLGRKFKLFQVLYVHRHRLEQHQLFQRRGCHQASQNWGRILWRWRGRKVNSSWDKYVMS